MIKANSTISKFYLTLIDSFSEYLSMKYSEISLNNPLHYKTIIIEKIVRMFHDLEFMIKYNRDEVTARCVLRGILDSVTTYCFIYERKDVEDMLFRHYLYILDGLVTYNQCYIYGIFIKKDEKTYVDNFCNEAIGQLKQILDEHPYSKMNNKNAKTIINYANWRYKSLHNPQKTSYLCINKSVLMRVSQCIIRAIYLNFLMVCI